ncbi:cytidylate kinase family protein [candidate division CSSED10-310 bacterium]|uniref:Cytidylate kinase family protein n=1 Tax=candidate division CSSED10-310 bacterium TaxID=2855610 RepID=A0ABV6YW86_UNCC1
MSIIILSGDTYSHYQEIAAAVAQNLNYTLIGPEVLANAAQQYKVPEKKLLKALEGSSSILGLSPVIKERYLAYFTASFMERLQKGKMVYHGRVGHLFVKGVTHVLKARLVDDFETRVRKVITQEGLTEKKARKLLLAEEKRIKRWISATFNVDEADSDLFDVTITLSDTTVDQSVALLVKTVQDVKFQPMTYSLKCMQDRYLASQIRALFIESQPSINVGARDGNVSLRATVPNKSEKEKLESALYEKVRAMQGVNSVEVNVLIDTIQSGKVLGSHR